jgi:hypothetical protein
VHVDFDSANERVGRWVVDVGRAPAAIPVICWRVFVCDSQDSKGGVIGGREDAIGGFGVVFGGVCTEGFDETLSISRMSVVCNQVSVYCRKVSVHQMLVLALQHETLHRVCFPRRMIEVERALCFYIVVPVVSQAIVFADEHFCASAR